MLQAIPASPLRSQRFTSLSSSVTTLLARNWTPASICTGQRPIQSLCQVVEGTKAIVTFGVERLKAALRFLCQEGAFCGGLCGVRAQQLCGCGAVAGCGGFWRVLAPWLPEPYKVVI